MFTDRSFGIEVEAYGLPYHTVAQVVSESGSPCMAEGYNHQTRRHWKVVSDVSLDPLPNAIELVSPPLRGEAGLAEIRKVLAAIESAGANVKRQCGLHVHVDARDLTMHAIRMVAERYSAFESEIDSFMPESRRGSNSRWCQPVRNLLRAIDWRVPRTLEELATHVGIERRYHKVNLHAAYRTHATVEFRQHSGTVNGTKAANWARFLVEFVEESKRLSQTMNGQAAAETAPTQVAVVEALRDRLAREGTIIQKIIEALSQPNGAGIRYLMAVSGWQRHTVRGAISEQLRTARGLNVISRRQRDGDTRYWIPGDRPLRSMLATQAANPAPIPGNWHCPCGWWNILTADTCEACRAHRPAQQAQASAPNGFSMPQDDTLFAGITDTIARYYRNRTENLQG
jgi:hypothetical protein